MAPTLILNSGGPVGSIDVSSYLDLTPDSDMDPYDPGWSNKVISHSLLKEGGVLALEDRQAKSLTFPLLLNSTTNSGVAQLAQQINQIINSPGATFSWQDTGMSQPTVFTSITGELSIKYNYRRQERFWLQADLKLYTLPFGHTAASRPYAAASAVGPLLLISPYSNSGALAITASTTGYGASGGVYGPNGASGGSLLGLAVVGRRRSRTATDQLCRPAAEHGDEHRGGPGRRGIAAARRALSAFGRGVVDYGGEPQQFDEPAERADIGRQFLPFSRDLRCEQYRVRQLLIQSHERAGLGI